MRHGARGLAAAFAAAIAVTAGLAVAPSHGAATADPTCVQTPPAYVLGQQVLPAVYQCLPPL